MNYVRNRGILSCLSWIYRVDQELHTLKSSQFKFGLSSEFSDFLEKIPVRISFNVFFRVFRFSKAS